MRLVILIYCLISGFLIHSQSIVGTWKTIDDETGKARAVVEIYQVDGLVYGKVIKIYPQPNEPKDPICGKCEDDRKDKKIIGMEIIRELNFEETDQEYTGGEILDPEDGNIYNCKLWVDEKGFLKVRGYVGFFFRTQTWLRWDDQD